jgi:1-pyrroline-5-carboxylate dehydrogenase
MASHISLNAVSRPPAAVNEPVKAYAPGSTERAALKARLDAMADERIEIPLVIGGRCVRTGRTSPVAMPFEHGHVLAGAYMAEAEHVRQAVRAALAAQQEWAGLPWEERAAVFLKASELLAGEWRATINAATMLGQAKTVVQAEIDAACELVDFWRFNVQYARELYAEQPESAPGVWNQLEYRGLEGFVYAISPFNFTSIAGNLPTAPALMGCTVVWKPASSALLSAHYIMRVLEAAGLPPGVINFVPGPAEPTSDIVLASPHLAGIHFTGSTAVFRRLWQSVAERLDRYRTYPRLVGETGGKDFILAHPSADPQALSVAIVRGGYEYQGQKCSAVSRVYVPQSLWKDVRERTIAMIDELAVGDVRDFRTFMSAVIDRKAFDSIRGYLTRARGGARILRGGGADGETGYFIEPTLVQATDPAHVLLCEEVFGPVVAVHVYPDARWRETLKLVDRTSPYGLTGAVFARDRDAIREATVALRHAAGNFYVNDKPTGAVVGQQPFGGGRASGTNDKAGSKLNLMRWVSARTIKENFAPPRDYRYPVMGAE